MKNQSGFAPIAMILAIVGILAVAGGIWYWQGQKGKPAAEQSITPKSPCETKDLCETVSDCKYVWYTGGCYNPTYAGACMTELTEKGIYPAEAPRLEGVWCTCENKKCITHN